MNIDQIRVSLLTDPPPWKYDPETGVLLNAWNKVICQTRYKGVYYNPTCIRVWLHTGFYPAKTFPVRKRSARDLPNGMPDGGPRDYRISNLGWDYET